MAESELFKPEVTDTARAEVAAKFAYLPADAAEMAAAYLSILESVDARHLATSEMRAGAGDATATAIADRYCRWTPEEIERRRRDWMAAREPVTRAFCRLLSLYPVPMIIPAPAWWAAQAENTA